MTGREDTEYFGASGSSRCTSERVFHHYLPAEVALHNRPDDCWVSYLGRVYDLTDLCVQWRYSIEIRPILANAGKDISHWFDHERGNIRCEVDRFTGNRVPRCPHGPIPDVAPNVTALRESLDRCPWWLDNRYKIGYLTDNPRKCKIINALTGDAAVISVCEEDTINRIVERFKVFNAHGTSYEWKFEGKKLDMEKTLTENEIPGGKSDNEQVNRFDACALPDDFYVPTLVCYFKDDLTEA